MSVNATIGGDNLSLISNFLLNFVATLLGVFAAFILTFAYDRRRKTRQEKETKKRLVEAVKSELSANQKDVNDIVNSPSAWGIVFHTSAYQSAIGSGDLSLLEPNLQTALSEVYVRFGLAERIVEKLFEMVGTETAFQTWDEHRGKIIRILVGEGKELQSYMNKADKMLADELKHLS